MNPDRQFANRFAHVVKKKLEKKSYLPIAKQYGPGYLVIPIYNPLFDDLTVEFMKTAWASTTIIDLGCFRSVRITFPTFNGYKFYRWPKEARDGEGVESRDQGT